MQIFLSISGVCSQVAHPAISLVHTKWDVWVMLKHNMYMAILWLLICVVWGYKYM